MEIKEKRKDRRAPTETRESVSSFVIVVSMPCVCSALMFSINAQRAETSTIDFRGTCKTNIRFLVSHHLESCQIVRVDGYYYY